MGLPGYRATVSVRDDRAALRSHHKAWRTASRSGRNRAFLCSFGSLRETTTRLHRVALWPRGTSRIGEIRHLPDRLPEGRQAEGRQDNNLEANDYV